MERSYVPKLQKASNLALVLFIQDIQANGIENARLNLSTTMLNEDVLNILNSIYKKAGVAGARLTYNELRATLKEGQKAGGFGRNERWLREVLNYLKINIFQFVASISETIKEDILKIVSKGVDEGWGIDKIVYELRQSKIPAARARTIARTEIVRAANVGHTIGAKEFPFEVNKQWSAAKDHRTRHSHHLVHNQLVDEYSYFDVPVYKGKTRVGTEQMAHPGDPKASPGNTINCRCRIVHIPKRDAAGNLIRRSTSATVIPLRTTPVQQLPLTGIAAVRKALANAIVIGVESSE